MIRRFGRQHPRSVAFVVLGAFVLLIVLPYLIWGAVDATDGTGIVNFDGLTSGIGWQATVAVVLVGIIWALDWFKVAGFHLQFDRVGLRSAYWVGAYPVVGVLGASIAVAMSPNIPNPVAIIAVVLLLNLFVGLAEETLFRGIVFGALRQKHQLFTAICVSSVAFGMLHLVNLGIGQALSLTLFQVVNATALGALFCAIALQANSIWPAIVLHMVWNSFVMLAQAVAEADPVAYQPQADAAPLSMISFVLPVILFAIAALILRNYVRRTQQSLFHRPEQVLFAKPSVT
jgi:membrane protease YdiL (CAAX protease family)